MRFSVPLIAFLLTGVNGLVASNANRAAVEARSLEEVTIPCRCTLKCPCPLLVSDIGL